ncbi:uncharacterized protein [Palaemon carinicauda]|uniref:uncharacterized protein n=1 Tax=Palaemon carinicauda TaxID=392227 RepID=UPI0035B5D395
MNSMAPKENQKKEVLKTNKKKNNSSKKHKPVIKTTLDNPFSVSLPIVWEELEEEIKLQLELCCSGLSIPILTPPWREVYSLKGEERIQYSQKYKKEALEKLLDNPESASKYEVAREGRSHLILGYNAVMRALEQSKLAGILLKKDIVPTFLGETFIPGCLSKNIPLVPLKGLDDILKREDTLGIKHNIMVLGLKSSVKESTCRFFPLYRCMQKILNGITETHRNQDKLIVKENSKENKVRGPIPRQISSETSVKQNFTEIVSDKINIKQNIGKGDTENGGSNLTLQGGPIPEYKLTTEEISSYHLKRVDKSKRVFIPDIKRPKKLGLAGDNLGSAVVDGRDMISFESSTDNFAFREECFQKRRPMLEVEKVKESIEEIKPVTFRFDFLGDTVGQKDTNDKESVFIPENEEINPAEGIINFESPEVGISPNRNKRSIDEDGATKQKKEYQKSGEEVYTEDFNFEFFLDTVGNQEDVAEDIALIPENKKARILDPPVDISFESTNAKISPERSKINLETAASSQLRGDTENRIEKEVSGSETDSNIATFPYIPAKVRRVKNNPDRKSNKKKL